MPACKQSVAALALLVVMDAEPLDPALEPNLDIEQFDSYVEQIGNLSDSIGEKAAESLEQFDKIDFSQFQLADKANAAVLNIFLQFNTIPAIREGRSV